MIIFLTMIYHLKTAFVPLLIQTENTDKLSTICSQGSCTVAQTWKKTKTKKTNISLTVGYVAVILLWPVPSPPHMNSVLQQYGRTGSQKTTIRTRQSPNSESLHTCVGTLRFLSRQCSPGTNQIWCVLTGVMADSQPQRISSFSIDLLSKFTAMDVWISSFNFLENAD